MAPSAVHDTPRNDSARWTVMVFMGVATIDGEASLHAAAAADLAELKTAAGAPHLNVFVQRHDGVGKVSRLHIGHNGGRPLAVPHGEQELESGAALSAFIKWSIERSNHQPEDHSLLVLWGHAYDFALGRRRTRNGSIDALDFAELSRSLEGLQKWFYLRSGKRGRVADQKLDIIGFDACDVATAEMAVQLGPYARFLLASQVAVPIPGWPYDRVLDRLINPRDRPMCPVEFGAYAVRRFCESYEASSPVSLSFLNLVHAPAVATQVRALSAALVESMLKTDLRDVLLDAFRRAQTAADRPYIDVADFCLNLMRDYDDDAVLVEAARLGDLLAGAHPPLAGMSHVARLRPFVIEHGRNSGLLARLHGLSLYAPHLGLDDPEEARPRYDLFDVTQDTVWSALIHAL